MASVIGLVASAVVGCGSSAGGLLTQDQASRLRAELDRAQDALATGRCAQAASAARSLQNSAQSLGGVDSKLVSNLVQGANTIAQLTATDCQPPAPTITRPPKPTETHTQTVASPPTTTQSTPPPTTSTAQTITPPVTTSTTGGGGLNTTTAPATPTSPATAPATSPATAPAGTTPATSTSGGAGLQGPGQ